MSNNRITIRVWGEYACFTRPEMKVERVSYPIMTPSAARGVLEAIFWEPQMCYIIDRIAVVKRGRWFSLQCAAQATHGFVSSRFVTTLVVAALLLGGVLLAL